MCVGLQMKLKFHLTYILLTLSTILAEDIYSRQSKRSTDNEFQEMGDTFEDNDSDEDVSDPEFESPELTTVSDNLETDKNEEISDQNDDKSAKITDSDQNSTEEPVTDEDDKEDKSGDDESEIFDAIEKNFDFDDLGSDVSGYDSYHGDPNKYKWKKKKGPPRYPPIDKDKLYEVALLAYTRDFHLGLLL